MSKPNAPTLIYPNGGETIVSPQVNVRWANPVEVSTDGRAVWYEIYYTDHFKQNEEQDWVQIATIPITATQFIWNIGNKINSSTVRVAIRSRNSLGERSNFSVSADNLLINRFTLPLPKLASPVKNGKYNSTIKIITDTTNQPILTPQPTDYDFFYESTSLGIPITPINGDSIAQNYLLWNVANLQPASDYAIYVATTDTDGKQVQKSIVSGITISHDGLFFIDTMPPESSVKIVASTPFTNQLDVTVKVYANDAATAPQSMKMQSDDTVGAAEAVQNVKTVHLSEENGIKTVQLTVQDFGANKNSLSVRLFEDVMHDSSSTVVDFVVTIDATWTVTYGSTNYLYKLNPYPTRVATINEEPTAIGQIAGVIYVATKTSTGKGRLSSYATGDIVSVVTFSHTDSYITSMQDFNNLLYIGTSDGELWSFDGATSTQINTYNIPITNMSSDSGLLYICFGQETNIITYGASGFVSIDTNV